MNCRRRRDGALWLLLLLALSAVADPLPQPLIVDLSVNGQPATEAVVLRDEEGRFFVAETVLAVQGIALPWPEPVEWRGGRYYGLHHFAGTTTWLDTRRMALQVDFPPAFMPLRRVELARESGEAWSSGPGAYLDYDINLLGDRRSGRRSAIGSFRPVVFGEFGHVSLNSLYRVHRGGDETGIEAGTSGLTVLDLTYTRDDPDNLRSLRVGDVFAVSASDGRALRLGGIQLARNFETRPELITYPLPSFYGEAALPTALDVYVNGRLTGTEEIQPGSYVLEDIPVVNGDGQVQVVARDALGRERIYSQDVYVSTELLRQGLSEYSLSVGAIREDYGLENFRYGELAASGNWRYGVRDSLTVETWGEATDGLASVGGGVQSTLPAGGTLNVGAGLSASEVGSGMRWRVGYRRLTEALNYSVDVRGMSPGFRVVGLAGEALPALQFVANASRNLFRYGSLGVSLVRQTYRARDDRTIMSASYSKGFRNSVTLSARVSYLDADDDDLLFGLRVSMPFGARHSMSGGFRGGESGNAMEAEINRSLPYGSGYGYRLAVGTLDTRYVDAGLDAQGDYGTYRVEVRDGEDTGTRWQAGTAGSIAYLDGAARFTREVRGAFAVVNVGDFEGVRVYAENLEVGRTDENGRLFVTGLRPYLRNTLRIETDDLPLTADIRRVETEAVPYARSGVIVDFDVRQVDNVLLHARLPDGRPVPEGARAIVDDLPDIFPVGLDGLLFLPGARSGSRVVVSWGEGACEFRLPETGGGGTMTRLGDQVCRPRQDTQP